MTKTITISKKKWKQKIYAQNYIGSDNNDKIYSTNKKKKKQHRNRISHTFPDFVLCILFFHLFNSLQQIYFSFAKWCFFVVVCFENKRRREEKKLFQFIWIIRKWNLWELNIIWRMSRFYKKRCIQNIWWIFFFVFLFSFDFTIQDWTVTVYDKKEKKTNQFTMLENFKLSTNFVWFFSFFFLTMQFNTSILG